MNHWRNQTSVPNLQLPGEQQTLIPKSSAIDEMAGRIERLDGGKTAWIVLLGVFCAFFSSLSMLNSMGGYQTWLTNHQLKSESASNIGWIFSFYSFFSFFAGLVIGPIFDAHGPRHLTVFGSILTLVNYLLLGVCRSYWHFFICIGVIGGLATCMLFIAAIGTTQHWFVKHRGFATGLGISGGSIGGIVFPLLLGSMLPRFGFATTTHVIAGVLSPFLTLAIILLRIPTAAKSDRVGFRIALPRVTVLLELKTAVMAVGLLLAEMALYIPLSFLPRYALAHGLSLTTSYRMLMFVNIGSLCGRWFPGLIAEKIGPFNMNILSMVLCTVSVLGIWGVAEGSEAVLTVFAVLFGFGSGSTISLIPVCIGCLCKTEEYGSVYSILSTVSSLG